MVNRPVASAFPRDAEQKVKPQKSLTHPLAGFLTTTYIYDHLQEMARGGVEGCDGTNPVRL